MNLGVTTEKLGPVLTTVKAATKVVSASGIRSIATKGL